jgi:hypothetical protein
MVGLTMRRCEHTICNLDLYSHLQNTRNFRAQSGSRACPIVAKQVIDHQEVEGLWFNSCFLFGPTRVVFSEQMAVTRRFNTQMITCVTRDP